MNVGEFHLMNVGEFHLFRTPRPMRFLFGFFDLEKGRFSSPDQVRDWV
jgi:hypothetical protein